MEERMRFKMTVDRDLRILEAPDSFYSYVGSREISELGGAANSQDAAQLRDIIASLGAGASDMSCLRINTAAGGTSWVAASLERTPEDTFRLELTDVQFLKTEERTAVHDPMTGLWNKKAITDYATDLAASYPRRQFYLVLLDIDHFKSVNDTLGHKRGDEVICDVAHIIRDCVGDIGRVGRIGGDEFMVVLDNLDKDFRIRGVLSSIRETVEERYREFEEGLSLSISIGTVLYPDHALDYDDLFAITDKMLYRAKMKGRNRYIIYTPEIHGDVRSASLTDAVTQQAANADIKIHLLLSLMDSFLRQTKLPIRTAVQRILETFALDEAYVFYTEWEESRYGFQRRKDAEGREHIDEVAVDIPILGSDQLRAKFDSNRAALLNIFDLKRGTDDYLIGYLEATERRFMLVYDMQEAKSGGSVVFAIHKDSAVRLSESDVADLIYFSRMLELTSNDR